MKKLIIIIGFVGISVVFLSLGSCTGGECCMPPDGSISATSWSIEGKIEKGTLIFGLMNPKYYSESHYKLNLNTAKQGSGFDLKSVSLFNDFQKKYDVFDGDSVLNGSFPYKGETFRKVSDTLLIDYSVGIYGIMLSEVSRDYLSYVLNEFMGQNHILYKVEVSKDFQGELSFFLDLDIEGSYRLIEKTIGPGGFYGLSYGKALADKLKEKGINFTSLGNTTGSVENSAKSYPVGEKEIVVIPPSSVSQEFLRGLIQAAKEVGDSRVLTIKRTAGMEKVEVTAFGQTTQIDAGGTYTWQFTDEAIAALRKLLVKYDSNVKQQDFYDGLY